MSEMKKVRVDSDEWYPVYSLCRGDDWGDEALLTDGEIAFVERAFADFKKAQDVLKEGKKRKEAEGGLG